MLLPTNCYPFFYFLEAVAQRYSVKKGGLQLYFKKRLWHRCFPVNFVKFLRILFLTEHLWWLLLFLSSFFLFCRKFIQAKNHRLSHSRKIIPSISRISFVVKFSSCKGWLMQLCSDSPFKSNWTASEDHAFTKSFK